MDVLKIGFKNELGKGECHGETMLFIVIGIDTLANMYD